MGSGAGITLKMFFDVTQSTAPQLEIQSHPEESVKIGMHVDLAKIT